MIDLEPIERYIDSVIDSMDGSESELQMNLVNIILELIGELRSLDETR